MKNSKKTNNLERIHQKTIQYTIPNTLIKQQTLIICILTEKIANILSVQKQKIYITTKCLKHLYDKKPAAIYDFILLNLKLILKYPTYIYQNKPGKRANICFVKQIKGINFLCALEIVKRKKTKNFVVTVFPLKKEGYLKGCALIWSWKDGTPSS